ncbi:MAG: alcohol dehydrogenase catalytic domain-containing protein [Sedimentisphaeraceae bacterium JB056]
MTQNANIPSTQRAVQLTGPDQLSYNSSKPVLMPSDYQILCEVEAVGLCFSDLKLLKQFSTHVRKGKIVKGTDQSILSEYPGYKTGDEPTVPGHEICVRVVKVGDKVTKCQEGERYLIQADHRWLITEGESNGAIGYNLEGGLEEYLIMDERLSTSPDGKEFMMLPAPYTRSASAVALAEPWACVEDSYVVKERTNIKEGGNMLVVVESDKFDVNLLTAVIGRFGKPGKMMVVGADCQVDGIETVEIAELKAAPDNSFDDVIYFGSAVATTEALFAKVASNGLFNIVLCGGKFDSEVNSAVGRVHYGNIRIIGTTTNDPAEAMEYIPATGEIREGDKIDVIGAGGPMGVMHVIRNICQGVKDVEIYAGDLDDDRLAPLTKIAAPLAEERGVKYIPYNPTKGQAPKGVDFTALMAPVPQLVAAAVKNSSKGGIINIFAGIPATVSGMIDLNAYIENNLYFVGTSGSTLDDMKTVLNKVIDGKLDTNMSVAAICDIESSVEGIRAVENHAIAGKIIVYPKVKGIGLVTLDQLKDKMPSVADKLVNGLWTKEAEEALLESC